MISAKKPLKYIKLISYGRHVGGAKHWDYDAWRHWYRWALESKR